jgi:uncharacterized protein with FMN-binding domain
VIIIGLVIFVLAGLLARAYRGVPSDKKISNRLIAMSSAAILAVYAAGYDRTTSAANKLIAHAAVRQGQYPDGDYLGWGFCRHGKIQVEVVIRSGRISSAEITKCQTRYPCSVIKDTPSRLVSRQNSEASDFVSGATQSVDAYYGAVVDALEGAAKRLK